MAAAARRGSPARVRTDRMYTNAMVFSGVAGAVSLALLLLLLLVPAAAAAAPLIVTLELGLLTVAGVSLLRIATFDRRMRKRAKETLRTQLSATACPDYWTLAQSDLASSPTCRRQYAAPDGTVYRVQGAQDEVDLARFRGRPVHELCKSVLAVGTPWTDARAACQSYAELNK